MTTLFSDTAPSPSPPPRPASETAGRGPRPLRDNPVLILLAILLLLAALVAMVRLVDSSAQFTPDFLSEVVLYALCAVDLTMLVALVFVLVRNIIKLVVERRRALPFARFRAKLVLVLLGMTFVPSVLVLIVGGELIRNSANRWFSSPVDEVLSSSREIASEYYEERQTAVSRHATRLARMLAADAIAARDVATVRSQVAPDVTEGRVGMVEVYQIVPRTSPPEVVSVFDVAAPTLPGDHVGASAERLAARVAAGNTETRFLEPLRSGGELVRAAALVRAGPGGRPVGVVVVSDYLTGELARHARRIVGAYEGYQQLRVLKRPLEGVYLSFFLMMTLFILVSATWMGLYLAKRITRPINMLAAGAREIGAGHFDHRIEPETVDEFGSLVDAFNTMAGELAASREKLERSRLELERESLEAEGRRRYIETILKRIATGVVSVDSSGTISTMNSAAARLLTLDAAAVGQPYAEVFGRSDLQPLADLDRLGRRQQEAGGGQEVALEHDGREVHLAVAATPLRESDGTAGTILVLDDVTPLIRAQRVAAWRDVARRLAHEIKNPLTPIQLGAERLRRHFAGAAEPTRALVEECSSMIAVEVESLKSLVDEFSQFARMPAPRTVPSDLQALLEDALSLYHGIVDGVAIVRRYGDAVPLVRVDPEQFRRVVINLVDNAVDALTRQDGLRRADAEGVVTIETAHDSTNAVVRVIVADNGPGISEGDRVKLFMPYYSTKRRGSGLGLAIVRRIIVEHGGSIEVDENVPAGARFTIELPC
ncbi:MAG: HAMP domain-containing protein [Luteitalea sp.]|nr:HAMP domain-containing protein [Luteitalea sp.]